MKVGEAVLSLDFVHSELDLTKGVLLVLLEICKGALEDSAFESVIGILETSGAVDKGLSDTAYPYRLVSQCPPPRNPAPYISRTGRCNLTL